MRLAVTEVAPMLAVTISVVETATGDVDIPKLAEVAPEGTVTLVGGTALESLDVRLTTVPLVGAGPVSVTVPVEGVPPTTDAGDTDRLAGTGGTTVNIAVNDVLPTFAVIVADVETDTE